MVVFPRYLVFPLHVQGSLSEAHSSTCPRDCTSDRRSSCFWPSVFFQGLDEKVIQAAHHGPGIINKACCNHGVFIDLKGRLDTVERREGDPKNRDKEGEPLPTLISPHLLSPDQQAAEPVLAHALSAHWASWWVHAYNGKSWTSQLGPGTRTSTFMSQPPGTCQLTDHSTKCKWFVKYKKVHKN